MSHNLPWAKILGACGALYGAIQLLLAKGAEWMSRHGDETKGVIRRVDILETSMESLGQRTARLEGANS